MNAVCNEAIHRFMTWYKTSWIWSSWIWFGTWPPSQAPIASFLSIPSTHHSPFNNAVTVLLRDLIFRIVWCFRPRFHFQKNLSTKFILGKFSIPAVTLRTHFVVLIQMTTFKNVCLHPIVTRMETISSHAIPLGLILFLKSQLAHPNEPLPTASNHHLDIGNNTILYPLEDGPTE